ncbi:MAG: hypothetical protein KGL39_28980 [Patescibacteria group bacterium]|nr:hypothetical protein [Patescibacteria group bacterium]
MKRTIVIRYNPESLADITHEEYHGSVQETLSGFFGLQFELDIRPGSVLRDQISLTGDWGAGPEEDRDPEDSRTVQIVRDLCRGAFDHACAGK